MSGRAKSGFPGRKVRKLSREASLGGNDTPTELAGNGANEGAVDVTANEVDSSSDSEPE